MREGDVLLASLPQADGGLKNRPALFLRELPPFSDVLLCGISTQIARAVPDFDEVILRGGLGLPGNRARSRFRDSFGVLGRTAPYADFRIDRIDKRRAPCPAPQKTRGLSDQTYRSFGRMNKRQRRTRTSEGPCTASSHRFCKPRLELLERLVDVSWRGAFDDFPKLCDGAADLLSVAHGSE